MSSFYAVVTYVVFFGSCLKSDLVIKATQIDLCNGPSIWMVAYAYFVIYHLVTVKIKQIWSFITIFAIYMKYGYATGPTLNTQW